MLGAASLALLAPLSLAQSTPKVVLDGSETLFTVLTAINTCGYDAELNNSDPVRGEIRNEVSAASQASQDAQDATKAMCDAYAAIPQLDASRTLSEYVSLALYLTPPPALALKVKEADLPPDTVPLVPMVPLIQKFYAAAGVHAVWERHRESYAEMVARYHQAVSRMLFDTEIYLKLPSEGYQSGGFTVYLDPMGAPGQTNARNYGSDYYVVIFPGRNPALKMDQIRHTYLHYLLDPLAMKYPLETKRLVPLMDALKTAPMEDSFRADPALLATECLIRAVEARTVGSKSTSEAQRQALVQESEAQGFILTGYFYDQLVKFEKSPDSLRNAYEAMLAGIDVGKAEKEAQQTRFAKAADPEVVHLAKATRGKLLATASQHLAEGDPEGAKALAQQALDEKSEDAGQALFILAQASSMTHHGEDAINYFQKAIASTQEPRVLAWSHIYLGRIFDLQKDRESALDQYRAALTAAESLPAAKAAAEKGIQQPYEAPGHKNRDRDKDED